MLAFKSWTSPETFLFVGDCRKIMSSIGKDSVDLVFADPPFNIGVDYGEWDDSMNREEYIEFTQEWIDACINVMSDKASIFINVPDHIVAEIAMFLKYRNLHMVNWCIWHYRFGVWRAGNFISSKSHCLYFCKDKKNRTWNYKDILVPSDRATKYNDKRTATTATPGMRPPLDVWSAEEDGMGWARIQGNNAERRKEHQNQLPERYLERVIKAASNPDDMVLDPFAGSGVTSTVARALGRRSVSIEIDSKLAVSAAERIAHGPVRLSRDKQGSVFTPDVKVAT